MSFSLLVQASLRRARWMHQAGRLEQNEIIEQYQEATKLSPEYVIHSLWYALERTLN